MQLLINFVGILFDLMSFAILARIIMSWIQSPGTSRLKMVLNDMTDPILKPFQIPMFRIGMIDISPIVALLTLDIVRSILIYGLNYVGTRL